MKKLLLSLLLYLLMASTYCVGSNDLLSDSTIVFFDFKQKDNIFYASYGNNAYSLNLLSKIIKENKQEISNNRCLVLVDSYCGVYSTNPENYAAAKIRGSHVKSHFILNSALTEQNFVTNNYTNNYIDGKTGVRVRIEMAQQEKMTLPVPTHTETASSKSQKTVQKELADAKLDDKKLEQHASVEAEITETAKELTLPKISLRTNLLYWAMLTPSLGVEVRIKDQVSILFSGAWSDWSWSDGERTHHLWKVNPELRYYWGQKKVFYLGTEFHTGRFDIRRSDIGRYGKYIGAGLTTGYVLQINKNLSFDFNLGLGVTHLQYDKSLLGLYQSSKSKNMWGLSQAGIVLAWKLH